MAVIHITIACIEEVVFLFSVRKVKCPGAADVRHVLAVGLLTRPGLAGHVSTNPGQPWHQNHIALLDCCWRASYSASHPTSAVKFTASNQNIKHVLLRKGLCFVKIQWWVTWALNQPFRLSKNGWTLFHSRTKREAAFLVTNSTHRFFKKRIKWRHGEDSMIYPHWWGNGMPPLFFFHAVVLDIETNGCIKR